MGDEKAAWVLRVLGVTVPIVDVDGLSQTLATRSNQPTADNAALAELGGLSARLDAVRDLSVALPHAENFIDDVLAANAALDRVEVATAERLIDSLEARLLSAERAKADADEIEDAKAIPGMGAVRLAKLRLQFRALEASRGLAISQLQASCRDVLSSGDPDDPRREEGLAAVASLCERVPSLSQDLAAAIDECADTSDKAKQDGGREKALREIRHYRAALAAQPMLQTLEKTPAGSYRIYGEMADSLGALESALAA